MSTLPWLRYLIWYHNIDRREYYYNQPIGEKDSIRKKKG
jgi:hypothetical protein